MVDENSVVDRNSIKLVDESSVVVENTGLKLEEVDEKTVVYQSVFSRKKHLNHVFNEVESKTVLYFLDEKGKIRSQWYVRTL